MQYGGHALRMSARRAEKSFEVEFLHADAWPLGVGPHHFFSARRCAGAGVEQRASSGSARGFASAFSRPMRRLRFANVRAGDRRGGPPGLKGKERPLLLARTHALTHIHSCLNLHCNGWLILAAVRGHQCFKLFVFRFDAREFLVVELSTII